MKYKNFSLLIVAGGKSSRLGTDKRFVEVGGVSLLENIISKAAKCNFNEIFLCVEENLPVFSNFEPLGIKILVDEVKNSGPMAALAVGLSKIHNDWALAVSTDIPFFDFDALKPLTNKISDVQAVIPICGGKNQMLAAFYHKNLAKIFANELASGQRKLFNAIKKIPHEFIEIPREEVFFNVNTRADLILARGRAENLNRTPIISIVAPQSGTGKTTFIEKLVKILSAQKIRVGVIKSDAHGFNLDVEGKDSYKFQSAGAKSVAVVSPNGYFLVERVENQNFLSVAEKMNVDLILTESRTKNIFPTISLWRGKGEVIKNEKIAAIFTSEPQKSDDIYQFDINDMISAEKIIKFLAGYSMLQISRPQFSH